MIEKRSVGGGKAQGTSPGVRSESGRRVGSRKTEGEERVRKRARRWRKILHLRLFTLKLLWPQIRHLDAGGRVGSLHHCAMSFSSVDSSVSVSFPTIRTPSQPLTSASPPVDHSRTVHDGYRARWSVNLVASSRNRRSYYRMRRPNQPAVVRAIHRRRKRFRRRGRATADYPTNARRRISTFDPIQNDLPAPPPSPRCSHIAGTDDQVGQRCADVPHHQPRIQRLVQNRPEFSERLGREALQRVEETSVSRQERTWWD